VKANAKIQAGISNEKPSTVASALLVGFDETVPAPTNYNLAQVVRRENKKLANHPAQPTSPRNFEVPDYLRIYSKGKTS